MSPPANPIFCAIDTPSPATALRLADQVLPHVGGLKLGLEFFSKLFNTVSDQVVEVEEDEKHWIWSGSDA